MKTEKKQTQRKTFIGTVISSKTPKTVHVEVDRLKMHPLYKKAVRRSSTFAVHNEVEGVVVGDTVKIASIRPMSKTKVFEVVEKLTI